MMKNEREGLPQITEAVFVVGAVAENQYPPEPFPEVAFAGRSNVGKSSLLNRVLNRHKLVRVSGTPGCTREVNFYRINGGWWFVDLPGYGYAKIPRQRQAGWAVEMERYLRKRTNLRAVVLLLDSRRGLTDLDRQMIAFLDALGLPYQPVATKADKLGGNALRNALKPLQEELATHAALAMGPVLPFSSLSGQGLVPLWQRLAGILDFPGVNQGELAPLDLPEPPPDAD